MKLKEFQDYLQKKKIDLTYFTHDDPNLTYFTQMKPSFAMFFISPTSAELYLSQLDDLPKIKGISVKIISKGLKKKLAKKGAKKIGINKESLTIASKENLAKIFPGAKFVDISPYLKELRLTKTLSEQSKISKACSITSVAYNHLLEELPHKKLKTEQDVALFIERHFRQAGAEVAFPTIVAMGKNAATPHHITSNKKLSRGFLLIDFGAKYGNYCADMTRVVFLGTPNKKEETIYNLLLNSQQAALDYITKNIKKGIGYSELDSLVRKKLGNYEKNFIHSLGHGIGLEIHEDPVFSNKTFKVQQHIPFTIEPGIYFPGKWGLRIEDTVCFNKKLEILTTASKELISIDNY